MLYGNQINVTKQLLLAFPKAPHLQMPYTHLSHTNNDHVYGTHNYIQAEV